MNIVTISRSHQTRTVADLRAQALHFGMKEKEIDAAIELWAEYLRDTYPFREDLERALEDKRRSSSQRIPPEPCQAYKD